MPTTRALAAELGVATTVVDEHMRPLAAAGFVAHTQEGSWVLAWNPETATLRDLYEALHLPFAGSWLGHAVLRRGSGASRRRWSGSSGRGRGDADDDRAR